MATARLTKTLRDEICRAAMKGAFASEKAKLESDTLAFSLKVYEKIVTKEQQELVAKLPTDFCQRQEGMNIRLSPDSISPATRVNLKFNPSVVFPYQYRYGSDDKVISEPLYEEFRKLDDRSEKIEARDAELKASINQVLYSAATVAKLLVAWPECDSFIPAWAKNVVGATNLPAVCVSTLNNLLANAHELKEAA